MKIAKPGIEMNDQVNVRAPRKSRAQPPSRWPETPTQQITRKKEFASGNSQALSLKAKAWLTKSNFLYQYQFEGQSALRKGKQL